MRSLSATARILFAALALVAAITAGRAQTDPVAAIEQARVELDRIEARLKEGNLGDAELGALKTRIEPMTTTLGTAIADLQPQLAAAEARVAEIGPKPKDGEPAESPEAAREREAQTAARQQIDETIRRGRLLQVEAAQVGDQITQSRRALLAGRLFLRSKSLIDPKLWIDVVADGARDLRGVGSLAREFADSVSRNLDPSRPRNDSGGPDRQLSPAVPAQALDREYRRTAGRAAVAKISAETFGHGAVPAARDDARAASSPRSASISR